MKNRSSHQRSSIRKGVLRNFAKLTGKHLYQSLFLNKVEGQGCNVFRFKNVDNVIIGTLNFNSLLSKFDEFKLVLSGSFDILIIAEIKLDNTFPTSHLYNVGFSMPYRLDEWWWNNYLCQRRHSH